MPVLGPQGMCQGPVLLGQPPHAQLLTSQSSGQPILRRRGEEPRGRGQGLSKSHSPGAHVFTAGTAGASRTRQTHCSRHPLLGKGLGTVLGSGRGRKTKATRQSPGPPKEQAQGSARQTAEGTGQATQGRPAPLPHGGGAEDQTGGCAWRTRESPSSRGTFPEEARTRPHPCIAPSCWPGHLPSALLTDMLVWPRRSSKSHEQSRKMPGHDACSQLPKVAHGGGLLCARGRCQPVLATPRAAPAGWVQNQTGIPSPRRSSVSLLGWG